MKIDLEFARKHFENLIDLLIDKNEEEVVININGVSTVRITRIKNNLSRVGVGKGKWKHISLEDLNSIDISKDF